MRDPQKFELLCQLLEKAVTINNPQESVRIITSAKWILDEMSPEDFEEAKDLVKKRMRDKEN